MIVTENLLLIFCLFQGIICNEFKAFMPQRIKALRGSCVLIPCTFTIQEKYEEEMVEPAKGIWRTFNNTRVFDSSRNYNQNTLKAELLGKVTNKNCTTIIYKLKSSDSKRYFFRAEPPKYNFQENVMLEVIDSPDRPAISLSSAVKEGAPTSLTCTAPAPCPGAPPVLVWSDTLNGSVEIEQVPQPDGTKTVSSVLTFIASHLHHDKDITCTAQYPVVSKTKSAYEVLTLRVLYSPKNTSVLINPSGEIHEGSHVTLSCISNASPAASSYTWFKVKGDHITEKSAEQNLTFTDINPSDSGLYCCEARNEHGAENSSTVPLNVAYMPQISHESSCSKDYAESITCVCLSHGSPSPITEWRIAGNTLENNTDRGSISNSKLEDHTMRSTLILLKQFIKEQTIQCLSKNHIGTASFQFHVFHEQRQGAEEQIHFLSALYGGFVCAAVSLLGFCFFKCVKKLMKLKSTARPKREGTVELTEINGLDLASSVVFCRAPLKMKRRTQSTLTNQQPLKITNREAKKTTFTTPPSIISN
ncbi:B-cell receptor CD22-like isoform X2 [Polyodon spathula]|uniref:B-cell receptor CD22-like isoform X2 n=1 Tax=Polyodon spathula TaxID=7913 RepID=UPI001B7ECCDA|nr:B-cell receptor CD22-like isoform X2 [Polyodon spathula]